MDIMDAMSEWSTVIKYQSKSKGLKHLKVKVRWEPCLIQWGRIYGCLWSKVITSMVQEGIPWNGAPGKSRLALYSRNGREDEREGNKLQSSAMAAANGTVRYVRVFIPFASKIAPASNGKIAEIKMSIRASNPWYELAHLHQGLQTKSYELAFWVNMIIMTNDI